MNKMILYNKNGKESVVSLNFHDISEGQKSYSLSIAKMIQQDHQIVVLEFNIEFFQDKF